MTTKSAIEKMLKEFSGEKNHFLYSFKTYVASLNAIDRITFENLDELNELVGEMEEIAEAIDVLTASTIVERNLLIEGQTAVKRLTNVMKEDRDNAQ